MSQVGFSGVCNFTPTSIVNAVRVAAYGTVGGAGESCAPGGSPPSGPILTYLNTQSIAASLSGTKTAASVPLGSATDRRVYVMGVWVDAAGTSRQMLSATIAGVSATLYSPLNTNLGGATPSAQVFAADIPAGTTNGTVTFTLDGTTVNTTSTLYVYQVDGQLSTLASAQFYAGDTTAATATSITLNTGAIDAPDGVFSLSICALTASQVITGWSGDYVPIAPLTVGSRFGGYKSNMAAASSKTFGASWAIAANAFMRAWIFNA